MIVPLKIGLFFTYSRRFDENQAFDHKLHLKIQDKGSTVIVSALGMITSFQKNTQLLWTINNWLFVCLTLEIKDCIL